MKGSAVPWNVLWKNTLWGGVTISKPVARLAWDEVQSWGRKYPSVTWSFPAELLYAKYCLNIFYRINWNARKRWKRLDKRESFNVLSMSPLYSLGQMDDKSKSEVWWKWKITDKHDVFFPNLSLIWLVPQLLDCRCRLPYGYHVFDLILSVIGLL